MQDEETRVGEDPIAPTEPPFRPWGASGVAQPGADRPASRVPPPTASVGPDLLPGQADALRSDRTAPERPSKFLPQPYPPYPERPGAGGVPQGYAQHPGYVPPPVRVEHVYVHASGGVSGSGLASFILGILSFLIPWFGLLSFAAVVLGLWSRGSGRVGRESSGDGFAIAGLILGITSFLLYLVLFHGQMLLFLFR